MRILKFKLIKRSLAWVLLYHLVLSFSWIGLAAAADQTAAPRVLVLPFEVNAASDASYLSSQIAQVLAGRLEQMGAQSLTVKEADIERALQVSTQGYDKIRELAAAYDVDQIIWGSFTLIGNEFSVDARAMESVGSAAPQRFFAQGKNLENLITVTNDLADRIAYKLLKQELVSKILIKGNQRIESDAILRVVKTQKGSVYTPSALSRDLRAIYAMGYFDDIRVEAQSGADGVTVTFHIKEKPTIRRIRIKGNNYIQEEDIRENLTINTGAILNIFKVRSNIDQIEALYKEKNYHKVKVDYEVHPLENNQADLEFIIDEGPKLYVTNILFEGNHSFSDKKLKKMLDVTEKGFFYWLTSSGDLDRAALEQDAAKLNAFYSNNGYINARIGDPVVDIKDEGIHITFKIDEGQQFKIGKIDITGDLIFPKAELTPHLQTITGNIYSRELIRNDVLALNDLYADQGYAYSDIRPETVQNQESKTVDITYTARKGPQVYFEKILIQGNTVTRDKVIRRELRVREQGLFSSSALKRSIRNLYTLEYFEDIKVDTLKGSDEDKMVLKLDVTEKPTGSFTFGAGYSSEEEIFITGSISKRNFLGRGQTLNFSGSIGSRTTVFNLRFTEPYLMDTRLSGTINAYNQEKEETTYDRNSQGGGLSFGYPVFDYTYFGWGYNLDRSEIIVTDELNVDNSTKELEGINITSSMHISLTYDSRNKTFNTTEGSKHSIWAEYAGLGGDIGFNKYIAQTMWYYPLYKSLIGFANAKVGYVHANDDNKLLPDYEKFYLGGINSLRGFGYKGVYLTEINDQGEVVKVGGEKMVQFNLELNFPLVASAGVHGVVFYDTGNVYDEDIDLSDLRQSAGAGIRWLSPFAPIRLEYGYILDRREGEPTGQWEFTMGGSF